MRTRTQPFDPSFSRCQKARTRTQVVIAALLGAAIATLVAMVAGAAMSDAVGESTYVPLAAERILDTRAPSQTGEHRSAWPTNTTRSLKVTDIAGVPATGVEAVVLNITTVNPTTPNTSFLTVYPRGETRPNTASINFARREIKNDIVIATVGTNGRINIYNQLGSVHLVIDVNGYYTNTTEARLANLETLLAGMTRTTDANGNDTLRLAGANFQITNGTGTTYATENGTGNLIIGTNRSTDGATRTGSHNLVIGDDHEYSANGTVIFGLNNTTAADATAVTGGFGNTASGVGSSVAGGTRNLASGDASTAIGGLENVASGNGSSVSGGSINTATGFAASVTGGRNGEASGGWSSVTGGQGNDASSDFSSVVGGLRNTASGDRSSVTGGQENEASGDTSVVTGGGSNVAGGSASVVSGGSTREVTGEFDWRAGNRFENQ